MGCIVFTRAGAGAADRPLPRRGARPTRAPPARAARRRRTTSTRRRSRTCAGSTRSPRAAGQKLAQMALQWALRDPRVTSAVIGASSVEQLDTNLDALDGPPLHRRGAAAIDEDAVESGINLWAERHGLTGTARSDGHDRVKMSHDQVRLRLRRGQQGPEGPARRQGRQPRRDDQPRAAGAARLHHHHRGLPGLPRHGAASDCPTGWPTRSTEHLAALEEAMGKQLGQADDPLLVSVRSGAKFSMPGMMETVLNIGLNDESVHGPGRAGRRRRAVRLGLLPPADPDVRQDRARHRRRRCSSEALDAAKDDAGRQRRPRPRRRATSQSLVGDVQGDRRASTPAATSRRTRASSCDLAVAGGLRLLEHRARRALPPPGAHPRRPRHRGQRLLDGLRQPRRWTPAPASPSPATRPPARQGVYGDYLQNAQGEDVVAGIRNTVPLADLEQLDKTSYDELLAIMATLEEHYRDLCDIEFTIERGKLWMLQTRVGKRTAGGGVPDRDPARRRGPDRPWTRRCAGSPAPSWPS